MTLHLVPSLPQLARLGLVAQDTRRDLTKPGARVTWLLEHEVCDTDQSVRGAAGSGITSPLTSGTCKSVLESAHAATGDIKNDSNGMQSGGGTKRPDAVGGAGAGADVDQDRLRRSAPQQSDALVPPHSLETWFRSNPGVPRSPEVHGQVGDRASPTPGAASSSRASGTSPGDDVALLVRERPRPPRHVRDREDSGDHQVLTPDPGPIAEGTEHGLGSSQLSVDGKARSSATESVVGQNGVEARGQQDSWRGPDVEQGMSEVTELGSPDISMIRNRAADHSYSGDGTERPRLRRGST